MGQVQEKQLIPVTYSTPETKAPIECQLYYHGFLEQEDAEEVLKEKGDFLVRKTKLGEQEEMVLSVLGTDYHHIFVLSNRNNQFRFESASYPTVHDLVFSHWRKKMPITVKSGAILLRAIPRTRWEPYTEKEMKAANKRKGSFGENSILPAIPPVPTMSGCNTLQSQWASGFYNRDRASSLKLLPLPDDLLPPPPPHLSFNSLQGGYYETPDGRSTISSRHNIIDESYPATPGTAISEVMSLRRHIPIHAMSVQEKRELKLELQIEVLELEKEKLKRQLGKTLGSTNV